MVIEKTKNNNIDGYKIIDDSGEYSLPAVNENEALEKYNAIKEREANPPTPSVEEKRKAEYLTKGLTPEKLTIALWEKIFEGKEAEANAIQAERLEVKQLIPKG